MYAYSEEELRYKKETVDELLYRGWIRPLKSPVASSIIFTRHRYNKKLQMYINYHALNNNIIKDHYPFPLINKTLRMTTGVSYLTRIDL